uniref:EF-hand domain-containing protein n=1 Tax=Trypanosoma congolense (strain IL3000) TaxID=1068625 RepID=G0URE7_TRYCI|nr:conserved hypothetical protein [Trypanosoma congolense IL3000]
MAMSGFLLCFTSSSSFPIPTQWSEHQSTLFLSHFLSLSTYWTQHTVLPVCVCVGADIHNYCSALFAPFFPCCVGFGKSNTNTSTTEGSPREVMFPATRAIGVSTRLCAMRCLPVSNARGWWRLLRRRKVRSVSAWCATFIFSAASLAGLTICAAPVALCHPLETPEYLIPYYLRNIKSRFRHYASCREDRDGALKMTLEDFVRSVLVLNKNEPIDVSLLDEMAKLFTELDADGDVHLNTTEYTFLMALLTAKLKDVRMLFSIVDTEGVGTVGLDEFSGVLRGLGCIADEADAITRGHKSGVMKSLFGEDGKRRCSYAEMEGVINNIKEAIWRAEFRFFDTGNKGRISGEEFGRLLANQMVGNHVPFYIVENIRKLHGSALAVTTDMWISFNYLMLEADEIAEAVRLFMNSRLPLGKDEFRSIVNAACKRPIGEEHLHLIMSIFDRNGDGVLEFDEFISLMKRKLSYQCKNSDDIAFRKAKHFPLRLMECIGESIRS